MTDCQEKGHLFTASVRPSAVGDVTEWTCQRCGFIRMKSHNGKMSGMSTPTMADEEVSDRPIYDNTVSMWRRSETGPETTPEWLACPLIQEMILGSGDTCLLCGGPVYRREWEILHDCDRQYWREGKGAV